MGWQVPTHTQLKRARRRWDKEERGVVSTHTQLKRSRRRWQVPTHTQLKRVRRRWDFGFLLLNPCPGLLESCVGE
jgi:hypothetical protein